MKAIAYSEWPKFTADRHTTTVAFIRGDLDDFAKKLEARPRQFVQRATKTSSERRYRCIFLQLSNGAYVSLTEWQGASEPSVELDMEVLRHKFVYEEDFAEIMLALDVDRRAIDKFEGNFTWLPNRKAKRIKRPEPPLPEDWWNHVRVLPDSDT